MVKEVEEMFRLGLARRLRVASEVNELKASKPINVIELEFKSRYVSLDKPLNAKVLIVARGVDHRPLHIYKRS